MDFKIFGLFFIILIALALIFKELYTMKAEYIEIISKSKNDNKELVIKMNEDMNRCVSHIKNISTDNLMQLKKINILNNQPISRIVNHYTETDESHGGNDKRNEKGVKELYMSDDTERDTTEGCQGSSNVVAVDENPIGIEIPIYRGGCGFLPTMNIRSPRCENELEVDIHNILSGLSPLFGNIVLVNSK